MAVNEPKPLVAAAAAAATKAKKGPDWFLLGLALAVVLAWLFPEPGARGGFLHPEALNKAGVALVFFLHGLGLSFAALRAGTLGYRVHVAVQLATFGFFPLLGVCGLGLMGGSLDPDLRAGFFYLCALPSTVSSSIAMTAAARGNVPAAVFNATASSLMGVFLTPLWLELVLGAAGHTLPVGRVIVDLLCWLVLPLVLGQLARPWLGGFVSRHRALVHWVDRGIILLLVYTSFCDSISAGVWTEHGTRTLVATFVGCALLLATVLVTLSVVLRWLRFPIEDRIAAVFCGSKKTLAAGVPMARLIFGAHPGLSVILLPIMIYHSLQLVVCGWLAARWARR